MTVLMLAGGIWTIAPVASRGLPVAMSGNWGYITVCKILRHMKQGYRGVMNKRHMFRGGFHSWEARKDGRGKLGNPKTNIYIW